MCRIAGIISNRYSEAQLKEKTAIMCQALKHGGPDDEGLWYHAGGNLSFGHRRLAIIDLSTRGCQPMTNAGKTCWITFNGEIYNYLELKDELLNLGAVFNTCTDTEVILQAYQHWGTDAFARLRGMFAFALYDASKNVTILVRDSSGIKPLYYHISENQLYFASETHAFEAAGLISATDTNWPIRFLAFGHIPEPYTTYKNVVSLPKGTCLHWDNSTGIYKLLFFDGLANQQQPIAADIARKQLRQMLDAAVKRQLIADAPIGVFLSGGTDSSLVTLRAAQHTEQLKTVSIYFQEAAYDESQYQEQLLQQTKAGNHNYLVTRQQFEEALPDILADMDIPTTDGVNSWFISKYARESGLKAVLSGLGADELFGGYPSFKRIKYLKYLKALPGFLLRVASKVPIGPFKRLEWLAYDHPVAEYLFLRGLFTPSEIAKLLYVDRDKIAPQLFSDLIQPDTSQEELKAAWYETNLYMQNQLLRDTDVMSMAHGLEVRVPFLDEDVQHFVNSLPADVRFDKRKQKGLLIDAYADVLPKVVWDRPKMGFSFPLQQWMRQHRDIADPDFYQGQTARKIIRKYAAGKGHWSRAFALYQLQRQGALKQKPRSMLLLTLHTFSETGGLQKMCRTMAYSFQKIALRNGWNYRLLSGYDHDNHLDQNYTQPQNFRGFEQNRPLFVWDAVKEGLKSDIVVLTHINMGLIGWLIKILNPKCKVWVVGHGIEVWRPLQLFKKQVLNVADKVISVSKFTRDKMTELHGVPPGKSVVLNNAIDPFLIPPDNFTKPGYLLQRYGLTEGNQVIFTLTRLASTEQYKGYEQVIRAIGRLKHQFPNIRYVLSGKYDDKEEIRLKRLIDAENVNDQVIVTGFIDENELEDHFLMADLFVLPSKKEGFGIVFIEAMACGLPVICGNADGSIDAIKDGELGTAVDTDNIEELTAAISNYFAAPMSAQDRFALQQKCVNYFNAEVYTNQIEQMLLAEWQPEPSIAS